MMSAPGSLAATKAWNATRLARVATTTVLMLYGIAILRSREFAAIDNVNLPIHETGHLVFGPFGELLAAMGGSLFQIIFPAVFVVYFARRRDAFAASVALWWVAENFWYVATYVADAREQALPLVGGGEHDWAFILADLGLLDADQRIAGAVRLAGTTLFVLSVIWGYRAAAGRAAASESSSAVS